MKIVGIAILAVGLIAAHVQAADYPIQWREQAYEPLDNVKVGDTVTFTWAGNHGVVSIPTGECPSSFTNNPEVKELAASSPASSWIWTADEVGSVWLACPVGDHCSEGQKIKITVV